MSKPVRKWARQGFLQGSRFLQGSGFLRGAGFLGVSGVLGLSLLVLVGLSACTTGKAPSAPGAPRAAQPAAPATELPQPIIDKQLFSLPSMEAAGHAPIRIGMLLPLSGSEAPLGRALLESAELAIFESGRKDLLLMPQDTLGSAATAVDAANKAIGQGADILLGPLLSEEVSAVTPVAAANHVPVIAFSSNVQVAAPGVYLLSFPPALEVQRVVSYAMSVGRPRIAAMIPDNSYGTVVEAALRDTVARSNGMLGPILPYASSAADLQAPARMLVQMGGFDAVLLPEGGTNLRALAPLLPYAGLDLQQVKLLGTGLWDDPSLGREPTLRGGWFAAPPPDARRSFAMRFRTAYGTSAPRIASLAYDAVALVAILAQGAPGERFTAARITNPNGFVGVDGVFRFTPDGRIERGLAVNEITANGITVVSPAPTSFLVPTQ